jgi:hypothetical protein
MAKPGYKHLGEVPEEVFQEELFKYLERREANPDAKKVPAQFEYNNKKYYFERSPTESGFRVRRSADFVAKEQRRRESLSKPKLSSIEKMMVKNIYEEASQRGLHVDHVDPAKIGGMHHPYNLKLMQPTENIRKGSKVGGDYKYEPLIESSGGAMKLAKPAGLAAAGIFALGPLGTAASAAETVERERIAQETQNPLDQFQAGVSKFSLGADIASYAPPAAIPATIASTGADILNLVIDGGRAFLNMKADPNRDYEEEFGDMPSL